MEGIDWSGLLVEVVALFVVISVVGMIVESVGVSPAPVAGVGIAWLIWVVGRPVVESVP